MDVILQRADLKLINLQEAGRAVKCGNALVLSLRRGYSLRIPHLLVTLVVGLGHTTMGRCELGPSGYLRCPEVRTVPTEKLTAR